MAIYLLFKGWFARSEMQVSSRCRCGMSFDEMADYLQEHGILFAKKWLNNHENLIG